MSTDQSGIRVTRLTDDEPATTRTQGTAEQPGATTGLGPRPQPRTSVGGNRETKPFFLTSEFLLAALTMLALLVAGYASDDTLTTWRTWLLVTVVAAAYIVSRGIAKAGSADRH